MASVTGELLLKDLAFQWPTQRQIIYGKILIMVIKGVGVLGFIDLLGPG